MAQESILNPEGLFNPLLRFAFTNITEETFTSAWGGAPIVVPAGATIELTHHLACKLTKELVDKIMIGNAKLDEIAKNQPYYRSPQGSSLGVPAARAVWEEQICHQMAVDEESPQTQVLRATIRAELMADMNKEVANQNPLENAPKSVGEFADLVASHEPVEKAPMKTKEVKIPKVKKVKEVK